MIMAINDVLGNVSQQVQNIGQQVQNVGSNVANGAIDYAANKVSQATGMDVSKYAEYAKQGLAGLSSDGTMRQGYTEDPQKVADAETAKNANTKSYADYIEQMYDAMSQQQSANIDYRTAGDITDAQRAYEDQGRTFADNYHAAVTQQYQGMDNQALESRIAGQFGGSATGMVNGIQAYYQAQRQQIALKQKELADNTVYEIQRLRRQGEFDKADALLKANQQKFTALYEDAIRVDENQYRNWQYDQTIAREDAARQREQEMNDLNYRRQAGMMLLQYGIVPDTNMLADMGISRSTAAAYIAMTKGG